ncbi:hypothetical protein [Algivirga pacifica]|uniref:CheC-like protein domain-containing protein n=1 Tax=Algivirga pacifica TaxID=1162670 RepID=A0ABP9DLD7_9BACT
MNIEETLSLEEQVLQEVSIVMVEHMGKAIGQLLNDEVFVAKQRFIKTDREGISWDIPTEEITVLNTEVVGDIQIQTYILLKEEYKEELCDALLPDHMKGQPDLREGMLLEMDNIAIAAMVTKVANLLQCNIFGHVPSLEVWTVDKQQSVLEQEHRDSEFMIQVSLGVFKRQMPLSVYVFFRKDIHSILSSFDRTKAVIGDGRPKKDKNIFQKLFGI